MVICFIIFPSLDGNVCDNIALSVCVSGVDVGKKKPTKDTSKTSFWLKVLQIKVTQHILKSQSW